MTEYKSFEPEFLPCFSPAIENASFVVLVPRQMEKWIFLCSSPSEILRLPMGDRLPNEDPRQTARRILFSQLGKEIRIQRLEMLDVFRLNMDREKTGILFLAELSPSALSNNCVLQRTLSPASSEPTLTAPLFQRVQRFLNMHSGAGELWDIYDQNRRRTGRLHPRGKTLKEGDYHLAVHIWLKHTNGDFLLMKRSLTKGFPGLWECPGGSALAGDDSLSAALREVEEETGFSLSPEQGRLVLSYQREQYFCDVWCFQSDFPLEKVRLLPSENCDACYAKQTEIEELLNKGLLVPYCYLEEFFAALPQNETLTIHPVRPGI